MIIDNAGGKDFAPDPLLDFDTAYDARIVGMTTIGVHEKKVWENGGFVEGKFKEVLQCIVLFEFTEDCTRLTRGEGDDEHTVPRTTMSFMKYDSHEKGGMFKLAKQANAKSVSVVNKKGQVNVGMIIGECVAIKMKADPKDKEKMYIDEITAIQAKHKKAVEVGELPNFQYDTESGAHPLFDGTVTNATDVPVWMLRYAINKALDAETFKMVEEMEQIIEAAEAEKEGKTELEGDRKAADPADKVADKKPTRKELKEAKEAEEERAAKAQEAAEKLEAEEAAKTKEDAGDEPAEVVKTPRKRRGAKADTATEPKHTVESLDALGETDAIEDLFIKEVGDEEKSEAALDAIDAAAADDDEFRKLLIEAVIAL
ncbi:hypothetical protein COPG_00079 [Colwellia phage 9A]|uniref:Uncharacterized protein n=1 Tax=Colwellia phage 9A TaxID=765765 RepID=I3UMG0_9CAUD|nr:hypothetical protein COPG_00079 [Colwellia phage 9A]AFK66675.1 hypothetical protein COPG_00079 [Colwellia phage 9A]